MVIGWIESVNELRKLRDDWENESRIIGKTIPGICQINVHKLYDLFNGLRDKLARGFKPVPNL